MRSKLSFANAVSVLALFVALGGSAYAFHLGKNSVGSKQLKKNAVIAAKIKSGAVTGPKIAGGAVTGAQVKEGSLTGTQINAATLGTVPNASHADSISAAEPSHKVGAPGEPPFLGGSENRPPLGPIRLQSVGFYKDHEGIVHLEGFAKPGNTGTQPGEIFVLPRGFRPTSGTALLFEQIQESPIEVFGSNFTVGPVVFDGKVVGAPGKNGSLEGITFRAES